MCLQVAIGIRVIGRKNAAISGRETLLVTGGGSGFLSGEKLIVVRPTRAMAIGRLNQPFGSRFGQCPGACPCSPSNSL